MEEQKTRLEAQASIIAALATGSTRSVEWLMNFGLIMAEQAAFMAAAGIISASQAAQQVHIIRELLAQDPNTAEVLKSLDRLADLLPQSPAPPHRQTAELIPAEVLERWRELKQRNDEKPQD